MRQGRMDRQEETDGGGRRPPPAYRPDRDGAAKSVLMLVARDQKIPAKLLLHPSRCRQGVAAARQLAMYLMHVGLGRSLGNVGQFFGRDRSTVSHACALVEDRRDNAAFDARVTCLEEQIENETEAAERGAREITHAG